MSPVISSVARKFISGWGGGSTIFHVCLCMPLYLCVYIYTCEIEKFWGVSTPPGYAPASHDKDGCNAKSAVFHNTFVQLVLGFTGIP